MANERGHIGLVDITSPDLTLAGCRMIAVDPAIQHVVERAGGPDVAYQAIMQMQPVVNVQTTQIDAVGSIGIAGAAGTSVDSYFHKLQWSSVPEDYTSSKHLKVTASTAALIPRRLSASINELAVFEFDVFGISSDGITAAMTATANQAMPASGDPSDLWTLGEVNINGTEVDVDQIEVDFGISEQIVTVTGDVYPTKWMITRRNPMIRIPSPEIDLLATLGIEGTTQGATDSTVVFRKITENGKRVAGGTASHVQVAIDDGLIYTTGGSANNDGMMSTDVVIRPQYDGTNAVIAITTDATF